MPALYVAGDRDMVVSFPGTEQLLANLRNFVPALRPIQMLPGCGHWTQQERPDEVNAAADRIHSNPAEAVMTIITSQDPSSPEPVVAIAASAMKQPANEAGNIRQRAMLDGPILPTLLKLALPTVVVLVVQTLVGEADLFRQLSRHRGRGRRQPGFRFSC